MTSNAAFKYEFIFILYNLILLLHYIAAANIVHFITLHLSDSFSTSYLDHNLFHNIPVKWNPHMSKYGDFDFFC